jgi:hypothetical protein
MRTIKVAFHPLLHHTIMHTWIFNFRFLCNYKNHHRSEHIYLILSYVNSKMFDWLTYWIFRSFENEIWLTTLPCSCQIQEFNAWQPKKRYKFNSFLYHLNFMIMMKKSETINIRSFIKLVFLWFFVCFSVSTLTEFKLNKLFQIF